MNTEHIFTIGLTLRAPILVKSSSPGAFGLGALVYRCAWKEDRMAIPGTLLEGRISEALTQLAHNNTSLLRKCESWFGREPDSGSLEPHRGKLFIDDLTAREPLAASRLRVQNRIRINSDTQCADEGALLVIEAPFAPGANVQFEGVARFIGSETEAAELARCCEVALKWTAQIGSNRSIGFGRIVSVSLSQASGRPELGTIAPAPGAISLSLDPMGPLCISKHKIGDNLFESENIIPGNMIAGAVLETWKALDPEGARDPGHPLRKHFDNIRFRHAFPSTSTARPTMVPFSVVKVNGGFQVLPAQVKAGLLNNEAPKFRTDWKSEDFGKVEPKFDWALPKKELRVRTAIDSLRRRADKGSGPGEPQGKLFATETVLPIDEQGNCISWLGRVDLKDVPDEERGKVVEALRSILSRLSYLSKTKVPCKVRWQAADAEPSPDLAENATISLVLQTPALLADPRFQDVPASGAINAGDLLRLYAEVWWDISGHSLELQHFYATQSMAGGRYMHGRFRNSEAYVPWLLTDAGSVFVLTVKNRECAKRRLYEWLNGGLGLPARAKQHFGATWKTNPYLPQNGFGEVALHSPEDTQHILDGQNPHPQETR